MTIKILIVDDNRDTLRMYSKAILKNKQLIVMGAFQEVALNIDTADDVVSAFEKIEAGEFDILIVDLRIPGLTGNEFGGLEIISRALEVDPLRPIIVITG